MSWKSLRGACFKLNSALIGSSGQSEDWVSVLSVKQEFHIF